MFLYYTGSENELYTMTIVREKYLQKHTENNAH